MEMGLWGYKKMKFNQKMISQAMSKLGVKQDKLDAKQVIFRMEDKNIIIDNPNVVKINMAGTESFQVTGEAREESFVPEISEEDIKTVADQAGVDMEKARNALEKHNGDLAAAIVELKG